MPPTSDETHKTHSLGPRQQTTERKGKNSKQNTGTAQHRPTTPLHTSRGESQGRVKGRRETGVENVRRLQYATKGGGGDLRSMLLITSKSPSVFPGLAFF